MSFSSAEGVPTLPALIATLSLYVRQDRCVSLSSALQARSIIYGELSLSLASRPSQASKLSDFCLSRGAQLIVLPCCQQESSQNSVAALVLSVCCYAYGAHFGCNFMRVRLEIRYMYVWQRRIVPVVHSQLSLSPPPPHTHTLSLSQSASYTCQVGGPGLKSATVNHPTHVLVELRDSSDRPCSQIQNVTAKLEHIPQATPTRRLQTTPTSQSLKIARVAVSMTSPSRYEVSYTAVSRGQHKLHVQVNDREINGSPFTITVYPDPTRLGRPVRVVTGLNAPYGIAYNSHGEMIVSERGGHRVSIFVDIRGQEIRTFGSHGDSPDQMKYPAGIAVDDMDNIYVSSVHKLHKFTSSGELIKCVGGRGGKEGEFNDPSGVTLYDNQVYVCDRDNHRIQVFDLDLNFVRSIDSCDKGSGEFDAPLDVKFDTAGNMYVAEFYNSRVQVLDSSGHFI